MNDQIKMQLSAFVDGELSDAESELLVRRISRDSELRGQIAEYQAIGRVMRGEYSMQLDGLLDRVNANLDSAEEIEVSVRPDRSKLFRPLVGVATAAAVAMVALVGYGQLSGEIQPAVAGDQYTVPPADLEPLFDLHRKTVSDFNTRAVSMQIRGESLEDPLEDPQTDAAGNADDEDDPSDSVDDQQLPREVTIEP